MIELVPGNIKGKLTLPSSKSHTLRAILFASIADGTSRIDSILLSPDTDAMIKACRSLGATIEQNGTTLVITGKKSDLIEPVHVDAGNSGIVLRFMAAVLALESVEATITGDESCKTRRPCVPLLEALSQMGARVANAPMRIQGPIKAGCVVMDGADSQPVSAIMIAATKLVGTTEIHVQNMGEKPWLQLTLDWLKRVGVSYEQKEDVFWIYGTGSIQPFTYTVPADLSSLAFPLVLALITESDLTIENVDLQDIQGDKILLSHLSKMGAKFIFKDKSIQIKGPQELQGCDIDVNDCIDALPILAVVGCFANNETRLYNGSIARKKESDRIQAMKLELSKMGANIYELPDGLQIRSSRLNAAILDSHSDHRVAMSLAVAAYAATGTSKLEGAEVVKKTYSDFFLDIERLKENIC
ncbi:MAG: 3-phosphoshikimate 1-carboxyvinyltransferase [Chlamydiales bacterium]|nr:3-phosphoshikimate 1-carboxyvinyltransferase [Chlamydiales bacterium]